MARPAPESPDGQEVAARLDLLVAALDLLPIGFVLEDGAGARLSSNRKATAPLDDLAGDALAAGALRRALTDARAHGSADEVVELHGSQPRRLEITASRLDGGAVVALLVDMTERGRLDAVRRDFMANVNHELRTPIGALALLAEALAGERDPDTVERLTSRISAEAERARALIDDLLDFSGVESQAQPPHTRVALADVADIAAARRSAAADQLGITIEVSHRGARFVSGDREQLVTAVANLVDNAVKYSDSGAVVRVTTSDEGPDAVVTVADDGIGIPARDLDRIFERFYRVDAARQRRTGGTGLGLAIVRHVAVNHGGAVSVRSEEGKGSEFVLRVPAELS